MRDILAALLRSRGYLHDDASDPNDMFWYGTALGIRPMLVCVAHEMNRDLALSGGTTTGWNNYEVATAYRAPSSSLPTSALAAGASLYERV